METTILEAIKVLLKNEDIQDFCRYDKISYSYFLKLIKKNSLNIGNGVVQSCVKDIIEEARELCLVTHTTETNLHALYNKEITGNETIMLFTAKEAAKTLTDNKKKNDDVNKKSLAWAKKMNFTEEERIDILGF